MDGYLRIQAREIGMCAENVSRKGGSGSLDGSRKAP
jgi:hypothetical protein